MGDVTPQMRVLRRQLQGAIKKFMERAERAGQDYQEAAISAVGTLAEEQTVLFACIGDPGWREACVAELMGRMPDAVRLRHAEMERKQKGYSVQ